MAFTEFKSGSVPRRNCQLLAGEIEDILDAYSLAQLADMRDEAAKVEDQESGWMARLLREFIEART